LSAALCSASRFQPDPGGSRLAPVCVSREHARRWFTGSGALRKAPGGMNGEKSGVRPAGYGDSRLALGESIVDIV